MIILKIEVVYYFYERLRLMTDTHFVVHGGVILSMVDIIFWQSRIITEKCVNIRKFNGLRLNVELISRVRQDFSYFH